MTIYAQVRAGGLAVQAGTPGLVVLVRFLCGSIIAPMRVNIPIILHGIDKSWINAAFYLSSGILLKSRVLLLLGIEAT